VSGGSQGLPKEPLVPSLDPAKTQGDRKVMWAGTAISHQREMGEMLESVLDTSGIPGRPCPALVGKAEGEGLPGCAAAPSKELRSQLAGPARRRL